MILSTSDKDLYYKLYPSLMVYVNNLKNIIPGCDSIQKFIKTIDHEERMAIRNVLFSERELIDKYLDDNPDDILFKERAIVKSWENAIAGKFYIFRHLKNYTVFLTAGGGNNKAYGVLGIETPLNDMFPRIPVMVEAVLLPFKEQIIYDGIIGGYGISFGGGIKRTFNEAYNEAKAKYGIITNLTNDPTESSQSKEDLLKYYVKSKANRERYWEEINKLVSKSRDLEILYHQEIGKADAKYYGKRLREIGMEPGWYAILEGLIVASGETHGDVSHVVERLVPTNKVEFVIKL